MGSEHVGLTGLTLHGKGENIGVWVTNTTERGDKRT